MPLTLDVPRPLDEELASEAQKEGMEPAEHAVLLLHLVTAILKEEEPTPFREAVRSFLSDRSLDPDQVSSAFDALVTACLAHDLGKDSEAFQEFRNGSGRPRNMDADRILGWLRAWRNAEVHTHRQAQETSPDDPAETPVSPVRPVKQRPGRTRRRGSSAYGKYAGIIPRSEEYMREKQREIAREDRHRE